MRLRFGAVCNYATVGAGGCLSCVEMFDGFLIDPACPDGAGFFPPFYFAAIVAGTSHEGQQPHNVAVRIMDADASELGIMLFSNAKLAPPKFSTAEWTLVIVQPFVNLNALPRGEYSFEVRADGERLGEVPFRVANRPNP